MIKIEIDEEKVREFGITKIALMETAVSVVFKGKEESDILRILHEAKSYIAKGLIALACYNLLHVYGAYMCSTEFNMYGIVFMQYNHMFFEAFNSLT